MDPIVPIAITFDRPVGYGPSTAPVFWTEDDSDEINYTDTNEPIEIAQ